MAALRGPTTPELDRRANNFEARVRASLRDVLTTTARALRTPPSLDDVSAITDRWNRAVDDELVPQLMIYWRRSADDLIKQMPMIGFVAQAEPPMLPPPGYVVPDEAALQYLATARNRLVGVGDLAWEHARAELVTGMHAGESVVKLRDRVVHTADLAAPRATTIARTEVVSASNAGAIASARALGITDMTKEWSAAHQPGRTRPSHLQADGQSVPIDDKFTVGGARLDHPGDPTGPAAEIINCRCSVLFDVPDDEVTP